MNSRSSCRVYNLLYKSVIHSKGLTLLLNTGKLELTESKSLILKKHCQAVQESIEKVEFDPSQEALTENLQKVKNRGSRLNATISTLTAKTQNNESSPNRDIAGKHIDW